MTETGRRVEPPTGAELAIIVSTMPDRLRAAVVIAAWGGLRYGELIELRRRDIIDRDGTLLIRVERGVTRVPGQGVPPGQAEDCCGRARRGDASADPRGDPRPHQGNVSTPRPSAHSRELPVAGPRSPGHHPGALSHPIVGARLRPMNLGARRDQRDHRTPPPDHRPGRRCRRGERQDDPPLDRRRHPARREGGPDHPHP